MDMRKARHRKDSNNSTSSKNYAAGVLPMIVSPDGEGKLELWVLLGLMPKGLGKAECLAAGQEGKPNVEGVWCCFWGWQDQGDLDEEDTAAREGSEESANLLGPRETIREHLLRNPSSRILPCLFGLYLGFMSPQQMSAVEEEFYHLRWNTAGLSKCQREMAAVRFFRVAALESTCRVTSPVVDGMLPQKQGLRQFLHAWLSRECVLFREDPFLLALRAGGDEVPVYPHVTNSLACLSCGSVMQNHERKYRKQRCNACWNREKRALTPCRFVNQPGGCNKGGNCLFKH